MPFFMALNIIFRNNYNQLLIRLTKIKAMISYHRVFL